MKKILYCLTMAFFITSCASYPRIKIKDIKYKFTTIDYPKASRTNIYGINDSGMVVGFYADENINNGFLFDGSDYKSISVPGAYHTSAMGINNAGVIVGLYRDHRGNHGFIYDGNKFTTIDFPGFIYTIAYDINDDGIVVGHYCNHKFGMSPTHGFLYDGTDFIKIDFPGARSTSAYSINNAGIIVGVYHDDKGVHSFKYDDKIFTSIDLDYPETKVTIPNDINDVGFIAGIILGVQQKGLIFDGESVSAIEIPESNRTSAWGVNNDGMVVGNFSDKDDNEHGFVLIP